MLTEFFGRLKGSVIVSAEEQMKKRGMVRKIFWIDFIVCFLFFAPFLKLHFSIDSYTTISWIESGLGRWGIYLRDGRFLGALIIKLVDILGVNLVLDTALGVFTFMFCSAWCMAKITEWVFDEKLEEKNWLEMAVVQMGCMTGFCNVFIAEWYQFTEALFVYAAAVLSCIYAAYFFKENRKILSFIFLAAGYNCYQVTIAFYVFLILFFILKKYEYRFDKRGCREIMIGALACGAVFVSNFLLVKLLIVKGIVSNDSRYNGLGMKHIMNNIILLLQWQKQVWINADGMMPIPLMAVIAGIMIFLAVVTFLKKEKKIRDACYVAVILTSGVFVVYLPISMLGFFWMPPRSIVPIFFFFTVLSFYIALQKNKKVNTIAICCLGILLSGMMYFTHVYASDIQYSNDKDEWYINMLQEKIEEYERQNNIKIEYLGFAADANICWRWDVSGNYSWDVLERIMAVEWAKIDAIRYYKGKNYEQIEVPEEYAQYFMQNDWNSPDMETQVRFDGNKCYIAVF